MKKTLLVIFAVVIIFTLHFSFQAESADVLLTVTRGGTGINAVSEGQSIWGSSIDRLVATSSMAMNMSTGAVTIGEIVINAVADGDLIVKGKVGIGTTTPLYKFSMNSGTSGFGIDSSGIVKQGIWQGTSIASAYIVDDFLLNTGDTATGNYTFDTNTLFIDSSNDRIGIGTSTPANTLEVHASTGTTTVSFISEAASVGSRLILEDVDGAGCSEITVLDGAITAKTVNCPAN